MQYFIWIVSRYSTSYHLALDHDEGYSVKDNLYIIFLTHKHMDFEFAPNIIISRDLIGDNPDLLYIYHLLVPNTRLTIISADGDPRLYPGRPI